MSDGPHVPPIPPDAKTAAPHAAPLNLNGPLPTEPTASGPGVTPAEDAPPEAYAQPEPQPKPESKSGPDQAPAPQRATVDSPQPVEAMFAQLHEDNRKLQKSMLIVTGACLVVCLLALWGMKEQFTGNLGVGE